MIISEDSSTPPVHVLLTPADSDFLNAYNTCNGSFNELVDTSQHSRFNNHWCESRSIQPSIKNGVLNIGYQISNTGNGTSVFPKITVVVISPILSVSSNRAIIKHHVAEDIMVDGGPLLSGESRTGNISIEVREISWKVDKADDIDQIYIITHDPIYDKIDANTLHFINHVKSIPSRSLPDRRHFLLPESGYRSSIRISCWSNHNRKITFSNSKVTFEKNTAYWYHIDASYKLDASMRYRLFIHNKGLIIEPFEIDDSLDNKSIFGGEVTKHDIHGKDLSLAVLERYRPLLRIDSSDTSRCTSSLVNYGSSEFISFHFHSFPQDLIPIHYVNVRIYKTRWVD
ncbi:hypothetical protein [Ferrimonas gelatinilytica]|uniref:hypothetical protein n=1 Tax=Ferrimonas gelatinilytica TaxID=1255257 RepID=UPI0031E860ED